jgi:hypothetical protein
MMTRTDVLEVPFAARFRGARELSWPLVGFPPSRLDPVSSEPPLQPTGECAVDGAIGEGLGEARIQWPPIPTLAILCAGGGVFWFLTFAAILYAL